MADIKTRDAVKGTIKTIDKAAIASERMKAAYAKTKDKAEQGYYVDESSATDYASDKVSYTAERVTEEGVHQFNKQGQKGVQTTKENIVKAKDGIADFKTKRAMKSAEKRASNVHTQTVRTKTQAEKTIKQSARSTEKTIKFTTKGTVKSAEKSVKTAQSTSKAAIKTAEHTAKTAQKTAQASVKAAQRAAQAAKATAKAIAHAVKVAVKATIAAVKAIIAGTKALISAIAAGGWVAVVIIIVICLVGLLVGSVFGIFFSGEDSGNGKVYETSSLMMNANSGFDMKYQRNKVHNLKLAATTIDKIAIKPNETFSFWQLVRWADRQEKYKDGLNFVNGKIVGSYGGGLCQLSNMLFWLFLHTPLTVIERHGHAVESFPSTTEELPCGTDATINEGWLDLKICNDTDNTFQVVVEFDDEYMYGSILSQNSVNMEYKVYNSSVSYVRENGKVYQIASVCRTEKDITTGKDSQKELYINRCEIGYELDGEIEIEERGANDD